MNAPVTNVAHLIETQSHARLVERGQRLLADMERTADEVRLSLATLSDPEAMANTSRLAVVGDVVGRLNKDLGGYGMELLLRIAAEADGLADRRIGGEEGWTAGRESVGADLIRARDGDGIQIEPTPNPYAVTSIPAALGDLDQRVLTFLRAHSGRRSVPHGRLNTWPRDVKSLRARLEAGETLAKAHATGLNVYAIVREVGEAVETDASDAIGTERRAIINLLGHAYGAPLAN